MAGLKFLAADFRLDRDEIDLIFRSDDGLAYVELKARSSEEWPRPAAASGCRMARWVGCWLLNHPKVKILFGIVDVLLKDGVRCGA